MTQTTPPARPDKKQRRNTLIQIGVALVVIVLVFGFVLPEVIDYRQVGEVLKSLSLWQFALLLAAGLIVFLPEGWLYALCMPGMSFGRGISSWIASTAAATTTPGFDVAVRYGMGRSYGGTVDQTILWIPLTGVFDNLVKFSLPIIAVMLIATRGEDLGGLEWVAVVAGVILLIGAFVVIGVFRSERFAASFADRLSAIVNAILRKLKRDPIEGISERILDFRTHAGATIKSRWPLALLAAALGKLWTLVILTMALRMVGLDGSQLSEWQIFVVWAIVMLITSIPITPGGIGIAALAYVWLFSGIVGDEYANTIAAGVVLYRLAQWALPIVVGWPIVWYWRRQIGRGELVEPFGS